MSELHDRLEKLAARGTRRGADSVLDASKRDAASMPMIEGVPDLESIDVIGSDDEVPFVSLEPVERRRHFGQLVAAVGVAALVGVGALAVSAVFGSGGAGSPEGAVRQLADAITHKDPLAAVDVLAPSEVRTMRQTVKDATQRAADLKIVNTASQPLAGVDLSVDHLQLSTQTLADGYAKVTITSGEISASAHRAGLSSLLQDSMHSSGSGDTTGSSDLSQLASNAKLPTFLIVVKRDGGWYISPAYTALEYAREAGGYPAADFGSAAAAKLGADTPESAVSDALRAWQAGNWDRMIALAPPDELPLYDYRAMLDQAAADKHPNFTIDKLSTSATVNGDSAVVKLDASGVLGDHGHWQVGGTCPQSGWFVGAPESKSTTATTPLSAETGTSSGSGSSGSSETITQGGVNGGGYVEDLSANASICLAGDLGQEVPFGLIAFGSAGAPDASGSVSIDVVREDGRWFVSPVTTALNVVDAAIQHVDQRTVYTFLGLAYRLPPDGTITLNQPFSVRAGTGYLYSSVYSFDGTAGEKVVGELEGSGSDYFASGEIYTADGHDVGYLDFASKSSGYGGGETTLPSTGSYRLVVTGPLPKDATLTLFDTAQAPKSLLNQDGNVSGSGFSLGTQTCVMRLGTQTCTAVSVPTTSAPATRTPATSSTPGSTGAANSPLP